MVDKVGKLGHVDVALASFVNQSERIDSVEVRTLLNELLLVGLNEKLKSSSIFKDILHVDLVKGFNFILNSSELLEDGRSITLCKARLRVNCRSPNRTTLLADISNRWALHDILIVQLVVVRIWVRVIKRLRSFLVVFVAYHATVLAWRLLECANCPLSHPAGLLSLLRSTLLRQL